ncbi:MAG: carboxymuconolactone decarboxylase family protein [Parafilimonas sp.]
MERISFTDAPAGMVQVVSNVEQYLNKSGLDKKLVCLLKFRASQINSCAYCLDMHSKEAIHAGETEKRLYSLSAWRETSYYSPKEKAALAFTEILTRLPEEEESDHIHDELSKYFSKQEIAYLTLIIAQINLWNRIVRSFGPVPGNYKVQEKVQEHEMA